jgi:membrane-bound serine protease (ClpP class)
MLSLGIALMVAGAGLVAIEAHVASYGTLGVAGLSALVAGAVLALEAAGASAAIVVAVAVLIAVIGALAMGLLVRAALNAGRSRVRVGPEALVGRLGVLRAAPQPLGQVFVDGALWQARASLCADEDEPPLRPGEPVVVERVKGLTLTVRRAEQWEIES